MASPSILSSGPRLESDSAAPRARGERHLRTIATGVLIALIGSATIAIPAQAAPVTEKQTLYPQAGPYVYTLEVAPRGTGVITVQGARARKSVPAHWVVRQVGKPISKVGGDTSVLPRLRATSLSYYQAQSVIKRFDNYQDFADPSDLAGAYRRVVTASPAGVKHKYERTIRVAAQKRDVNVAVSLLFQYAGSHYTAAYMHAHKRLVLKKLKTLVQRSSSYRSRVVVKFVSDSVIDYGDSSEPYVRYAVIIKNDTDKTAYQATANTHDGPDTAKRVAY